MADELRSVESRLSHLGKEAIIVTRMHQSGKSAITGLLQCLYVQFGDKHYSDHSNINSKYIF